MEPSAEHYEKLGAFYLGREIDGPDGDPTGPPILYDAKDLTTHAVIVGMTGSGKTGLAVGMLEEAAIDGVPAIALDVKGDLTNLLLTFPELRAEDFRPWMDPAAAARKGKSVDELAESTSEMWRSGLASWGQDGSRIQRFRDSVDLALYTPGSTSGTPLSLLGRMDAPPAATLADGDAFRDRIMATVDGLLTLLGIEPDPVRSRDHILLSTILDRTWRDGRSLELADLIRAVQDPPFRSVGVVDLDAFFPPADRTALAMALNNLLASPGFQSWREGEPLDVSKLLYNAEGKPRLSILYLAHLSDSERMFFVTRLLGDVVSWMRTQQGTGSLRALLYMDEVFGYFPPTANPPSKRPLLTLMKQARAYGLGVVLATQNPVDLDYKGLSNAGTWMLGRLQTERDKMRVLDGLEGAASGGGFDRKEVDQMLSGLGKRRFLLHNVHDATPQLFHTRWVMSYLAGPLTVAQVRELSKDYGAEVAGAGISPKPSAASAARPAKSGSVPSVGRSVTTAAQGSRPLLDSRIEEVFVRPGRYLAPGTRIEYRPRVYAATRLHFVNARWGLDTWSENAMLAEPGEPVRWSEAVTAPLGDLGLEDDPVDGATYGDLPSEASSHASYREWKSDLKDWVYRERVLRLLRCEPLKAVSAPGEDEASFRSRLRHAAHEQRDLEVERLRAKYSRRLEAAEKRIRTANERVQREEAQYSQHKLSAALSVGTAIFGAFLGKRRRSSVSGASTAARGFGRAAQQRQDVEIAEQKLEDVTGDLLAMENELSEAVTTLREAYNPETMPVETVDVTPRKSDIRVENVALAWTPWVIEADGSASPAL